MLCHIFYFEPFSAERRVYCIPTWVASDIGNIYYHYNYLKPCAYSSHQLYLAYQRVSMHNPDEQLWSFQALAFQLALTKRTFQNSIANLFNELPTSG